MLSAGPEDVASGSASVAQLMWILYQVSMALALLLVGPLLLVRRGLRHLPTIPHRLGRYDPEAPRGALWIHAVSVGEVGVAATLIRALPPEQPILVTTVTPTGQERAATTLGDRATVAYLPYDLGFAVRSFFRAFEPSALILTEGDYWPLVLREAERRQIPIAVVNGRVSDRSYRRMTRVRSLLAPLFDPVDRFGMQTDDDRRRLTDLGVADERITTTGNLKFDTAEPAADAELERWLHGLADGRPVLVAGSTMRGEEELVLDAFASLGGGESALLVLAPRHPERWEEVAQLIASRRWDPARRSSSPPAVRPAVALLDTLGELAAIYRWSAAAFIGGTLVPTGGHNPIEAARFGVPVAVGPSMENFQQIADDFDRRRAWRRVDGASQLAAAWSGWIGSDAERAEIGDRGAELVAGSRGAIDRTLEMLRPIIVGRSEGRDDD